MKQPQRFLWTLKAESRAKELNLDKRINGNLATFAGEPLYDGPTARAWMKRGYVIMASELL